MKTDGQLENLEKLTHDIEFAQIELQVVEGLKQGNEALKKVNDALNIEDIERILDETREAKEKQDVSKLFYCIIRKKDISGQLPLQEISTLLSGGLTAEDEDAVENELAEILKEQMPDIPTEEVIGDGEASEAEEEGAKQDVKKGNMQNSILFI